MKTIKANLEIAFIIIVLLLLYFMYVSVRPRKDESGYNREYLPEIPELYGFKLPMMFTTFAQEMGFDTGKEVELTKLPAMVNLKYSISNGKDNVFPMVLTKHTNGIIELPFKMSLLEKGYPYKYIDVSPDDEITVVDIKDFTYSVDGQVFFDTFLVTDKDYLIAYSAASENFGIKG